jgi:hypothetical protein
MALASTITTLSLSRHRDIALIGLRAPHVEALRTAQTTGSTKGRRIAGGARRNSREELSDQQAKRRNLTGRPTAGREAAAAGARAEPRAEPRGAILASEATALRIELGTAKQRKRKRNASQKGMVIAEEEEKQERKRQRESTYIYTTTAIENQPQ